MRAILVLNPVSDRDFVDFAEAQLDPPDISIAAFEERLRLRYPRVDVHARDLAGEPVTVWYVYRDGHWTDPRGPGAA